VVWGCHDVGLRLFDEESVPVKVDFVRAFADVTVSSEVESQERREHVLTPQGVLRLHWLRHVCMVI
jgi:hypothetical protein